MLLLKFLLFQQRGKSRFANKKYHYNIYGVLFFRNSIWLLADSINALSLATTYLKTLAVSFESWEWQIAKSSWNNNWNTQWGWFFDKLHLWFCCDDCRYFSISSSNVSFGCSDEVSSGLTPVWPDLTKFRHFDKTLQVLWQFISSLAKCWVYFGNSGTSLG